MSKKDATPEGVSEEQKESQAPEEVDPRLAAMEAIADKVKTEREPDMVPAVYDDDPVKEEQEPEPVEEAAAEPTEPTEELVKIKVDGEEREVPLSQIRDAGIRALQKESAADKRLEEATRLFNEAKRFQEEKPQTPPLSPAHAHDAGKMDRDKYKELVKQIQYGDEDSAVRAFEEAVKLVVPPTPTLNLNEIVDTRINQRTIKERLDLPPDAGGFGDLTSDPFLKGLFSAAVDQLAESKEDYGKWETYKTAGERLRALLTPKEEPKKDGFDEKRERKQQADTIKGAGVKQQTPAEPKPQSRTEIVREMQQMRGQEL